MKPINLNHNRIESIDIAKGIGILLMVMGHTGFGDVYDKLINTFHMPLFFFVSGYFYRPNKTRSFKEYLIHQINVLIVPYVAFAFFYEILHYIFTGEISIQYFAKSLLSSNHNRIDVAGALWFLLALFSSKIIYCLLEHRIKGVLNLTIVVTVISLAALTLRKFDIKLPLCIDTALSMLIVIHSGYLLYAYRGKQLLIRFSTLSPIVLILLTVLFFASGLLNDNVLVRRNKFGIEVLYFISCFCGIILTMNISHILSRQSNTLWSKIKDVFSFWGRESIVFLLINELFLFLVSELFIVLGASRDFVAENYWIRGLIVLGAMALMSIVVLFTKKKPLAYFFGKANLIRTKCNKNVNDKKNFLDCH